MGKQENTEQDVLFGDLCGFFHHKKFNMAVMEINNNVYFQEIVSDMKRTEKLTFIDVSRGSRGGNILWLKGELEKYNNVVLYGWARVFPEEQEKYLVWAQNFNILTGEFYLFDRKILFVLSSFLHKLLDEHAGAFKELIGTTYDFSHTPALFADMDTDDLLPNTLSTVTSDDARKNVYSSMSALKDNEIDILPPYERAIFYYKLSDAQRTLGDFSDAERSGEESKKNFAMLKPPPITETALCLTNLSFIYQSQNKLDKALSCEQKGLDILNREPENRTEAIGRSNRFIAQILLKLGRYEEAVVFGKKALDLYKKILPQNHPDFAKVYSIISKGFKNLGELGPAFNYALDAMKVTKGAKEPNQEEIAHCYYDLGLIFYHFAQYDKAIESIRLANSVMSKYFRNQNHPLFATCNYTTSQILKMTGDLKGALAAGRKALEILEAILSDENHFVAASNCWVGFLFFGLNIKHTSLNHYKKAIAIWEKIYPPTHPDIQYCEKLIKMLNRKL
ncbi:MAG: uncharacterized protein HW421_2702 [Ignavibacteria bacterium]|nr:uncharacterized protein [Ignavibacteria bacterium]